MKFFILIHSVSGLVCLRKLIEKGYKPEVVITHKEYEREKLGKDFFLPIQKLCKIKKIKLIQSDTPSELINEIKKYPIGFCVGYMKILRKDFYEIPGYGIFNLHCGKLPEYRGRAPISRTIMNGDSELYITLHKIDSGVDSGPVAIETKIKITLKDDVNSLYKKFSDNSYKSIIELLKNLRDGKLNLRKQRATRKKPYKVLNEKDLRIDWRKKQIEIFNKIRAFKLPYPRAHSFLNGKEYLFNSALMGKSKSIGTPGRLVKIQNGNLYINTKDKTIKISEVFSGFKKINHKKEFTVGDKFI